MYRAMRWFRLVKKNRNRYTTKAEQNSYDSPENLVKAVKFLIL